MSRKNIHLQKVLTITPTFNRIKIAFELSAYDLITYQKNLHIYTFTESTKHQWQNLYIVHLRNMEYRDCFPKSSYTRALTNFHGLWILLSTLACTHEVSTTNIFDY